MCQICDTVLECAPEGVMSRSRWTARTLSIGPTKYPAKSRRWGVGKKIIDPAVSGFPIRARRLCDLTGAFHFDRKQVRLGKAMTECGIIIERVVACDRMRPRAKGLCCFYSRQKTPIAPYGKNLFWRHQ